MTGKKLLLFALLPLYALGQATFTNPQPIILPDGDPPPVPATPYPSEIHVTGLQGSSYSIQVVLHGFSHTFPAAADILLVAPDGTSLVLLSDAGGANDVNGLELRFRDSAAAAIPEGGPMAAGTFLPSNYGHTDTWPLPAPPATRATTLATFNGTPPNGTWRLYAVNDVDGTYGTINAGWTLLFYTLNTSLVVDLPSPVATAPQPGWVTLKWPGRPRERSVEVEWSADGRQWKEGGHWAHTDLTFQHRPPVTGKLWYRLRSGRRYSLPVGVEVAAGERTLRLRWSSGALLLQPGPEGAVLRLTDLQGRIRYESRIAPGSGEAWLPDLPGGLYLLQAGGQGRLIRI